MNKLYTSRIFWMLQAIFVLALGGFFMLLGGFFSLVAGLVTIGGLIQTFSRLKLLSKLQMTTYHKYKMTYPQHVNGRGAVSCFSCNNSRIQVRALLDRTYHREHFCPQCGKTLYYSPED